MKKIKLGNQNIGDIRDIDVIIKNESQMMDIVADSGYHLDCNTFILNEQQFSPDFFNLSTKILGAVLQKCKNYNVRLAIIGDYSKFESKALADFIYESNNGSDFYFVDNYEQAIKYLQGE